MALASAQARWDAKHADLPFHDGTFTVWSADRGEQTPFRYSEGVRLWVATSDVQPDDEFL